MLHRSASALTASAATARAVGVRSQSTASLAYRLGARKHSVYVVGIIVSAVVLEVAFGKVHAGLWASLNKGKTFESVDWTKWKVEEEE